MPIPAPDLPLLHAGKVRRLYALDDDRMLLVATDHVSAFDHVLPTAIPGKGIVLTQLSRWWFEQLSDVENHLLDDPLPAGLAPETARRAMVVERLAMVPVECVARGYLTGSGWQEYRQHGTVCGIELPAGLRDGDRLPEPIFTPATKAPMGQHDENVTFEQMCAVTGAELGAQLRDLTLAVYARAEQVARERGLILADTKLEFGRRADGTLVLADEVLTPDSSRYWDATSWAPGTQPDPYDKQIVRNWLLYKSGWNRQADQPPPPLPDAVVASTRERYAAAYERLTGHACADLAAETSR